MASRRVAAAIAGAVAACALVASCAGPSSLDAGDVEAQVAEGLAAQVGGEFTVTCPGEIPAEAGYTFTCSVADTTGGATWNVEVVEDDGAGAFTWRVVTAPSS